MCVWRQWLVKWSPTTFSTSKVALRRFHRPPYIPLHPLGPARTSLFFQNRLTKKRGRLTGPRVKVKISSKTEGNWKFENCIRSYFIAFYGWPGHKMQFLCNRLNHARCDRRGLFSIRTKCGLLNRLPTKVMGFKFWLGFCIGRWRRALFIEPIRSVCVNNFQTRP